MDLPHYAPLTTRVKVGSLSKSPDFNGPCLDRAKTLYINGKFAAQSMTGVQRTAIELTLALDRRLAFDDAAASTRCVLLCPPGARPPALRRIKVRTVGPFAGLLQGWEQIVLPWAARDGLLLNLAGSAPWWSAKRSLCMLHDAAVFDFPQAYTPAFRIWYRRLFRRLARSAAGLITVSAFSRERLSKALGVPTGRFGVVLNAADHFHRVVADESSLSRYGLIPHRFLLVVGTAKLTKNIEAVLTAWRRLKPAAGCALVWVGGENTRVFAPVDVHLNSIATDVDRGILHIGVIPDSVLKALYKSAAGLVMPSLYEGFGLPTIEAMACGCPVAAASTASLPEVCGGAAKYFDPRSVEDICSTMNSLLEDAELRDSLTKRGLEHAAKFTWDDAALAMLTHLNSVAPWRNMAA